MKLRDILNENISSWTRQIELKYNLKTFSVIEHKDIIRLSSIVVRKEDRGNGTGTKVMKELCDYADNHKKTIILSPATKDDYHGQGPSSQSRLIEFYKRFGFVLNKGKNLDLTISEMMYRKPQ